MHTSSEPTCSTNFQLLKDRAAAQKFTPTFPVSMALPPPQIELKLQSKQARVPGSHTNNTYLEEEAGAGASPSAGNA